MIRQTGELLEKLKKKQYEAVDTGEEINKLESTKHIDVSERNKEMIISGAKLSFEDTEKDNFLLLQPTHRDQFQQSTVENNFGQNVHFQDNNTKELQYDKPLFNTTIEELMQSVPSEESNVPSPSEILKNLCLTSERENAVQENHDVIHDFLNDFNEFL